MTGAGGLVWVCLAPSYDAVRRSVARCCACADRPCSFVRPPPPGRPVDCFPRRSRPRQPTRRVKHLLRPQLRLSMPVWAWCGPGQGRKRHGRPFSLRTCPTRQLAETTRILARLCCIGFAPDTCPTYVLAWGRARFAARRIYLTRNAVTGSAGDAEVTTHVDALACRASPR